jgi:uncharacterized protein
VRRTGPERRCLGCGARAAKGALARFVAVRPPGDDGHDLTRDDRARLGGRGLYVCPREECFDRAVKRRAFARGARLSGELRADPSLRAALTGEGR